MPVEEVCLDGLTGSTLEDFFIELVDGKKWEEEIRYEFHQTRNNERPMKASFRISPNPTRDQPGNGLVDFKNLEVQDYEGHSHKALSSTYYDRDFSQSRKKYLQCDLRDVEEDETLAANVLLSFEVARRVDEKEKTYPLTRSEVKEAIKHVMSLGGEQYDQKVTLKLDHNPDQNFFDLDI